MKTLNKQRFIMSKTPFPPFVLRMIFSFSLAIAGLILGFLIFFQPANNLQARELSMGTVSCSSGAGNVTGTVFRDFDADGVADVTEVGVAGITVTAYSDSGLEAACVTDAAGMYTLTVGVVDYPLRLSLIHI